MAINLVNCSICWSNSAREAAWVGVGILAAPMLAITSREIIHFFMTTLTINKVFNKNTDCIYK